MIGHMNKQENYLKNLKFCQRMQQMYASISISLDQWKIRLLFQIKWTEPDEEGLVSYMVNEKGFS